MVKLVVTDLIRKTVLQYNAQVASSTSSLTDGAGTETRTKEEIITEATPSLAYVAHERLVEIVQHLRQNTSPANDAPEDFSLTRILKGTQVYIPSRPVSAPKSQEYLDRMARLKHDLEEAEYQTMIRETNSSFTGQDDDYQTPATALKELKHQISTILNVIISVLSVSWALWYWSGSSASNWSLASRTLLSLFGGLVVLIADVAMYSNYLAKIGTAKKNERSKKEITSVISTMQFGTGPIHEKAKTMLQPVGEPESTIRKRK
ncbi:hypothetical protein NADFUDRAFT_50619 [Nadsonia fulvescens var. elongata DSM 6958]|uniref:Endoplasmic reticulum-based factor for assembly of V-ATPase n=1 Tax=Nadsonia fulvescens var. elongata DSM 6958 TaxID=857566 RepID=A0A1E3PN11_9ASCO|nr:hypothetical protein NADFUDRAFT_50619 [Nadsonia fulvescens var. elongata DSM 6958]